MSFATCPLPAPSPRLACRGGAQGSSSFERGGEALKVFRIVGWGWGRGEAGAGLGVYTEGMSPSCLWRWNPAGRVPCHRLLSLVAVLGLVPPVWGRAGSCFFFITLYAVTTYAWGETKVIPEQNASDRMAGKGCQTCFLPGAHGKNETNE